MKGKWAAGIPPRNFTWIVKDQMAVSERPGGFAPHHRRVPPGGDHLVARAGLQPGGVAAAVAPQSGRLRRGGAGVVGTSRSPRPGTCGRRFSTCTGISTRGCGAGERLLVHQEELGPGHGSRGRLPAVERSTARRSPGHRRGRAAHRPPDGAPGIDMVARASELASPAPPESRRGREGAAPPGRPQGPHRGPGATLSTGCTGARGGALAHAQPFEVDLDLYVDTGPAASPTTSPPPPTTWRRPGRGGGGHRSPRRLLESLAGPWPHGCWRTRTWRRSPWPSASSAPAGATRWSRRSAHPPVAAP